MDQRTLAKLKKLQKSKVIIIRHANSCFNNAWETTAKDIKTGKAAVEKYKEVMSDPRLLDCSLSELGV